MAESLEDALISVWKQALVENKKTVELAGQSYPVRKTARRQLSQVDFTFDGKPIRGLQQNPETKSRWAQLARAGKNVMQFLSDGRYIANVADGKITTYGGPSADRSSSARRRTPR
jgi:hypothetical protein